MSKSIKGIKIKTSDIATAGVFLAFILIFVLVPFESLTGVSLAFIPLIAVILAATVKGFGMGLFTGVAFGLASLLASYIHPTWTAPMFHNPVVSVIPRAIIPITVYFTFRLVKWFFRNKRDDVGTGVASTVATIVGVCTNTLLVLGMWAAFYFGHDFIDQEGIAHTINGALLVGVLTSNFIMELIICTVLCPIICTSLRIALGIDKRGRVPASAPAAEAVIAEGEQGDLSEGKTPEEDKKNQE